MGYALRFVALGEDRRVVDGQYIRWPPNKEAICSVVTSVTLHPFPLRTTAGRLNKYLNGRNVAPALRNTFLAHK